MLAYYAKRSPGEEFEEISRPIESGMWLDGSELSDHEIEEVARSYKLETNIVYDVRDRQELPRVEFTEHDAYVFLRLPHLGRSGHVVTTPLLAIVQPDRFFTLSTGTTILPSTIPFTGNNGHNHKTTSLLLGVIASCVATYEALLKHTERSINDTGNKLKTHEITNQDFVHFVVVEDNLTAYRMNLGGILAVITRLKETSHHLMTSDHNEALDDIALHTQQLLVAIESYAGRVESIRNAYGTVANNTLNQRMKTLTVFTVLITLPNLFYGMFGMNVKLPFMNEPWAYGAVVGGTVIVVLIVYLIGRRMRIF